MKLDDLELLYLRQVVVARIDSLTHKLDKNLRYYGGSDDDILKERKIGNLEAEMQTMESIKKKLNEEIALPRIVGAATAINYSRSRSVSRIVGNRSLYRTMVWIGFQLYVEIIFSLSITLFNHCRHHHFCWLLLNTPKGPGVC